MKRIRLGKSLRTNLCAHANLPLLLNLHADFQEDERLIGIDLHSSKITQQSIFLSDSTQELQKEEVGMSVTCDRLKRDYSGTTTLENATSDNAKAVDAETELDACFSVWERERSVRREFQGRVCHKCRSQSITERRAQSMESRTNRTVGRS